MEDLPKNRRDGQPAGHLNLIEDEEATFPMPFFSLPCGGYFSGGAVGWKKRQNLALACRFTQ